jgi:hypothetical protein
LARLKSISFERYMKFDLTKPYDLEYFPLESEPP